MDALDQRFRDAYETLDRLKEELLAARMQSREEPATWGGWSVRFNQRLRGERQRMAILLEPPDGAAPQLAALYAVGAELRQLYEQMNRAMEGKVSHVAEQRVTLERAMHQARDTMAG